MNSVGRLPTFEYERTGVKASEAATLPVLRTMLRATRELPPSVVCASFSINCTGLLLPLVVMQVYDRVIPNHSTETLLLLCAMTLIVLALEAAMRTARARVVFWIATRLAWITHDDALRRVMNARPEWWTTHSASAVVDRLRALTNVAEWQGTPSRIVLLDLPFVAAFLLVLAIVGGALVLVPIVVFTVVGTAIWMQSRRLRQAAAEVASAEMRLNDFLVESLAGAQVIKGNALEALMQRRHERLQNGSAEAIQTQITLAEEARALADLLASLTQMATMAIGATAVMQESLTIGTLACCTLLAGRAVQPLLRCVGMWNEIQSVAIDHARAAPIRDLPSAADRARSTCSGPVSVRLTSVTTPERPDVASALLDADLYLAPGTCTAILGHSGPGTSSIVALLTNRIVASRGTIELAAVDSLPPAVVTVSGLHKPFEGSLLDNLTGFQRGPMVQVAMQAARLIGLEEDIHQLPNGYSTQVGGISSEVPDGIVRRIAIARAIALAPGLLVLDGANESLDSDAERRLVDGLKALEGRMTLLIVTNRPSFAAMASRVLTIEAGTFGDLATGDGRVSS